MTKKETELFDGLVTLVAASMEVQKETLVVLKQFCNPVKYEISDLDEDGAGQPRELTTGKFTEPTLTPTPTPAPKPTVEKPREYTIEDCRNVLGAMVEKLGEDRAWAYLKTFNIEMLPDLDPSQYAVLVQGAEAELTA